MDYYSTNTGITIINGIFPMFDGNHLIIFHMGNVQVRCTAAFNDDALLQEWMDLVFLIKTDSLSAMPNLA